MQASSLQGTAPGHGSDRATRSLVTGGAGFIGSHLTDLLLARGDHVTVVDDLSTGRRNNLPQEHPRLRFIEADLGEAISVLGKGETFDEIYHLAAAVGVELVMREPIRSIEVNVEQTAAILHFAQSHGTSDHGAAVLVASSSEVYGKSPKSPFHEDDDVVYGPTTAGRWSYACSKAIDEFLALATHRQHSVPIVVARFFNTVGPRQIGEYGMVLPRFVSCAVEGRPLRVFGDGTQRRCFCDVRDVVRALPTLLATNACHGRVFNIGSDTPITIADLARLVIELTNSTSTIEYVPYDEAYPEGFEDLKQRRPCLDRIRDAINFAPALTLADTILDLTQAAKSAQQRTTPTAGRTLT